MTELPLYLWVRHFENMSVADRVIKFLDFVRSAEINYDVHKIPPVNPFLAHLNPVHIHILFLRSILILYSYLCLGLASQIFLITFCMYLSSLSYVLPVSTISFVNCSANNIWRAVQIMEPLIRTFILSILK
jgi:hypothetical protein